MITVRDLTFDVLPHEGGMLADNLAALDVIPSPLRTVIDVGAHVGFTAIPAAARGARVYALEPNPWTYATLVKNIECNKLCDQIVPLQLVLAPRGGQLARLQSRGRGEPAMTGLVQPEHEPVVGEAVTITPEWLFAMVAGRIDYLKMDIEGCEHYVLPLLTVEMWRRIAWFHLEIHDLESPETMGFHASWGKNVDLEGLLQSQGFVQVKKAPSAVWRNTNPL